MRLWEWYFYYHKHTRDKKKNFKLMKIKYYINEHDNVIKKIRRKY